MMWKLVVSYTCSTGVLYQALSQHETRHSRLEMFVKLLDTINLEIQCITEVLCYDGVMTCDAGGGCGGCEVR